MVEDAKISVSAGVEDDTANKSGEASLVVEDAKRSFSAEAEVDTVNKSELDCRGGLDVNSAESLGVEESKRSEDSVDGCENTVEELSATRVLSD